MCIYMYIFIYLHIPKWIATGRHDDSPTHVGVPNFRQTHELIPRDTCLVLHFEQQIVSVGGEGRSMIQLIEPLADEFGTLRSLVAVTSYHPCCWDTWVYFSNFLSHHHYVHWRSIYFPYVQNYTQYIFHIFPIEKDIS